MKLFKFKEKEIFIISLNEFIRENMKQFDCSKDDIERQIRLYVL